MVAPKVKILRSKKQCALRALRRSIGEELGVHDAREVALVMQRIMYAVKDVTLKHGECSVPGLGTFSRNILEQTELSIPKMGSIVIPTRVNIEFSLWVEIANGAQNPFVYRLSDADKAEAQESARQKNRLIKKLLGLIDKPESAVNPFPVRGKGSVQKGDNDDKDNNPCDPHHAPPP